MVGHERIHAMAEVRLDRTRVVTVIGELVAAGMAQHMGMGGRSRRPTSLRGDARKQQFT